MTVGIIGAGGTGSAVAEQLVRMGVRRVILVDDDRLVPSNVSRVYGSTPNQGRRKRLKVDVLSRHLKKIAPGIQIESYVRSVNDPEMRSVLVDADVVFGCTDTDGSRATLNDLAYRYFVPVIDLGCRIEVTDGIV
ncbi:UBA/THIF-type NAD/FAD binding fold domain protein, partial [mine drainage metagenome]